jgi:hypothetical protein
MNKSKRLIFTKVMFNLSLYLIILKISGMLTLNKVLHGTATYHL